MANTNIQSVEPNIADLVNGWLKSYKIAVGSRSRC